LAFYLSDGKLLNSGDLENQIHIWDPTTMKWMHRLKGKPHYSYFVGTFLIDFCSILFRLEAVF
jgi:WD40 repeat protein